MILSYDNSFRSPLTMENTADITSSSHLIFLYKKTCSDIVSS